MAKIKAPNRKPAREPEFRQFQVVPNTQSEEMLRPKPAPTPEPEKKKNKVQKFFEEKMQKDFPMLGKDPDPERGNMEKMRAPASATDDLYRNRMQQMRDETQARGNQLVKEMYTKEELDEMNRKKNIRPKKMGVRPAKGYLKTEAETELGVG